MHSLADTYSKLRSGIVAFAPKYPELVMSDPGDCPHLSWIFGTGFIVGDSLIATNKHVVDLFQTLPKPPNSTEIPAVALYFAKTVAGLGICALNVCEAAFVSGVNAGPGHHYATTLPDVALVSVSCTGLAKHALSCSRSRTLVGTEIATAGFPLGQTMLAPCGQLERFGPILQRGIVAAESPFQEVEPHAYLIDVMVQGGASGSPVFRVDNGDVIGALNASQIEPSSVQSGKIEINIILPTSFSYVVPSQILCRLIDEASDRLLSNIPHRAPSIEELFDQMPTNPTDKITAGIRLDPHQATHFSG